MLRPITLRSRTFSAAKIRKARNTVRALSSLSWLGQGISGHHQGERTILRLNKPKTWPHPRPSHHRKETLDQRVPSRDDYAVSLDGSPPWSWRFHEDTWPIAHPSIPRKGSHHQKPGSFSSTAFGGRVERAGG